MLCKQKVSEKVNQSVMSYCNSLFILFLIVSCSVERVVMNMDLISPFMTGCTKTPYKLKQTRVFQLLI